jgi:hypothetical protein
MKPVGYIGALDLHFSITRARTNAFRESSRNEPTHNINFAFQCALAKPPVTQQIASSNATQRNAYGTV